MVTEPAAAIADRYRRVAGQFTDVVLHTPDDAWSNPSPCEGWDARDVVRHNVDMAAFILGLIERSFPAGTSTVDEDPVDAWLAARDTVQGALDDLDVATQIHAHHRHLGQGPWNRAVDMVLTSDLVIHAWDLGHAVGIDVAIDPDEVHRFLAETDGWDDAVMRTPEVFGPALDPPPGADEQTRLLAFLGRRP